MPLNSSAEQPQPLREVVRLLKGWVERTGPVWVEGQVISSRRRAGSRIQFLTLRDKLADVSVTVTVDSAVLDAAGPVPDGTLVSAYVKAQVYPGNGSLSFACADLRPSGEGRLLAHLEQRKRALQAEGLFNPDLKKRLPFLPRRIGLITARESAAERDVVENV
ncbi:MAG: exodeoxyribonuclease VII large subunit, partial [Propionibacteriaceae bacterium]|nr:exodeoxyribonuclease VII large subunit [Propionibacteriaceae bacterium]